MSFRSCHFGSFLSRWIAERHCDDFARIFAAFPPGTWVLLALFPTFARATGGIVVRSAKRMEDALFVVETGRDVAFPAHVRPAFHQSRPALRRIVPLQRITRGGTLSGCAEMKPLLKTHASSHGVGSLSGGIRHDHFYRRFRHTSGPFRTPKRSRFLHARPNRTPQRDQVRSRQHVAIRAGQLAHEDQVGIADIERESKIQHQPKMPSASGFASSPAKSWSKCSAVTGLSSSIQRNSSGGFGTDIRTLRMFSRVTFPCYKLGEYGRLTYTVRVTDEFAALPFDNPMVFAA